VSVFELTDEQKAVVAAVRDLVEQEVYPIAEELEHRDEFPEKIVERMKEMGLFGLTVPEEFGGAGMDLMSYALVVSELSRGWMSLSGVLNTHFMGVNLLPNTGTYEQKQRWPPRMATGELRAALSMSEPGAGSDVQAIRCRAVRDGEEYVVNGQKMWVTNGLRAGLVVLLCKTDPDADPLYRGISILYVEKEPGAERFEGITVPPNIPKIPTSLSSCEPDRQGMRLRPRTSAGGSIPKMSSMVGIRSMVWVRLLRRSPPLSLWAG
jgi:butyryl-CoA dehydrogenase